jgi:hypothetical protein
MLGYKETDVLDMQYAIEEAVFYLPPSNHDDTRINLQKTWDFLDGILAEGHVQ